MRGPGPDSWLERPVFVAIAGFVVGAAAAGIILFIVLRGGGDNNNSGSIARRTVTARATGAHSPVPTGSVTPGGAAATPGTFGTARDALAAFVVQRYNPETYAGPCSETGAQAQGICSSLLYESDILATFKFGHAKTEDLGEAVIQAANGKWTLAFLPAPATRAVAVGADAIVYEAGDCLKFHPAPSTTSNPPLSCELDGTRVHIFAGPQQAEGITWWQVQDRGWASAEYLIPAP